VRTISRRPAGPGRRRFEPAPLVVCHRLESAGTSIAVLDRERRPGRGDGSQGPRVAMLEHVCHSPCESRGWIHASHSFSRRPFSFRATSARRTTTERPLRPHRLSERPQCKNSAVDSRVRRNGSGCRHDSGSADGSTGRRPRPATAPPRRGPATPWRTAYSDGGGVPMIMTRSIGPQS